MCKDCGCEDKKSKKKSTIKLNSKSKKELSVKVSSKSKSLLIEKSISEPNDHLAEKIAEELKQNKILAINLMGAPGSGKTTFIEGISKYISPSQIAVIQGDLESDVDKKRLEKIKILTEQINTHSGCHLNATMISMALRKLNLLNANSSKNKINFLIIENVGNLVCPAGIKIGQHINVVVSSTTEGSDKPKKYPYIFMDANLVVVSKADLAGAVGFNEGEYMRDIRNIARNVDILKVSSKDPDSFYEVAHFLEHEREHVCGLEHGHESY